MDARPKASEIKKYLMWSKINQLKREGHSISKIKMLTGYDRKTIRKYLSMTEEEFRRQDCCVRHYTSRLDKYRDFIVERLRSHPFLSSGAIHAQLRLNFDDLEKFDQKTVYNYVMRLRREEDIPKDAEGTNRPYCMLEQTAPGEYAQADFGEKWLDTVDGGRKKVYFFVLLLSRWRYKYVLFSDRPFTSELAVYAHEMAFDYLGGVPVNIVYDQDKVLISDENLGDYILTQRFRGLVAECRFNAVFCRKSDPESKGKVENAVGYVKHNFLAGYTYTDLESLQADCLKWLDTTANGLPNATTRLIPKEMFFQEERERLLPYKGVPTPPREELPEYNLRKDNTISYRGNYYAVPLGSYRGRGTAVRVLEKDGSLEIYSKETGKLLMRHAVAEGKGQLVSNTTCRRNPDVRIGELQQSITEWFNGDAAATAYIQAVRDAFPRNIRDNLAALKSNMEAIGKECMLEAMALHLDAGQPGVNAMLQTARNLRKRAKLPQQDPVAPGLHLLVSLKGLEPEKTPMAQYAHLFN